MAKRTKSINTEGQRLANEFVATLSQDAKYLHHRIVIFLIKPTSENEF